MVHDDGPLGLDGVQVKFDDERVVSDAGIALAATLAARLGIEDLAQRLVRLRPDRGGRSEPDRVPRRPFHLGSTTSKVVAGAAGSSAASP